MNSLVAQGVSSSSGDGDEPPPARNAHKGDFSAHTRSMVPGTVARARDPAGGRGSVGNGGVGTVGGVEQLTSPKGAV